jgi:hypothetical protein
VADLLIIRRSDRSLHGQCSSIGNALTSLVARKAIEGIGKSQRRCMAAVFSERIEICSRLNISGL